MNKKLTLSYYLDFVSDEVKGFNNKDYIISNSKIILNYIIYNNITTITYNELKKLDGIVYDNNILILTIHILSTSKNNVFDWVFYENEKDEVIIHSGKEAIELIKNGVNIQSKFRVSQDFIDKLNLF